MVIEGRSSHLHYAYKETYVTTESTDRNKLLLLLLEVPV